DIWGWTDPQTSREYAIMGMRDGTAFVDVTDGRNPIVLGKLPTHTGESTWRDIKVYEDHAYIVSDNNGPHGVQIFDLTRLRGVTTPQTFNADYRHSGVRSAHNIAINEETGYAYVTDGDILDLSNPANIRQVGTVAPGAHDYHAAIYRGPDTDYVGSEILFASYGSNLQIFDVTNKSNPELLSVNDYERSGYVHQGWLTEDHNYFIFNDENDTRWSHVYDVSDLENPDYRGSIPFLRRSIDHNGYIKGDYLYSANYTTGLWVLELTDPANAEFTIVANYDTFEFNNGFYFDGAWSVYPYFESGNLIVSDMRYGLFVLTLDLKEGDFDYDEDYGCGDIDALTRAIATGDSDEKYDLDGNEVIDQADLTQWLAIAGNAELGDAKTYLPGDSNLDGVVDTSDFNRWNASKFQNNTAWCSGDFNADGTTDISDFNLWNARKFQSSDSNVVPEPEGLVLLVMAGLCAASIRKRRPTPKS
ncbi:MAG: choice-of-anchor B family protein, partial [Planctomycetota bacterium]